MGVLKIIFSYVFSLMLAVMINEVRVRLVQRTVQTISYLPHFVSWVVAANLIFVTFSPDSGIVNEVLLALGIIDHPVSFMGMPQIFWLMVALADVWKSAGYNAIVYLAAMTSIDPRSTSLRTSTARAASPRSGTSPCPPSRPRSRSCWCCPSAACCRSGSSRSTC